VYVSFFTPVSFFDQLSCSAGKDSDALADTLIHTYKGYLKLVNKDLVCVPPRRFFIDVSFLLSTLDYEELEKGLR